MIGAIGVLVLMAPQPCFITTYATKYHLRHTSNGEVYDHYKKLTLAVPPRFYKRLVGKTVIVSWKGRSVAVHTNDKCPGGTFDLSGRAWKELTRGAAPGKLRGTWRLADDVSRRESAAEHLAKVPSIGALALLDVPPFASALRFFPDTKP